MKSELPKVLHTVCGLPMVEYAVRALQDAGIKRPTVVIGHGGELVKEFLGDRCDYVWQHEQLGTGHAVTQCQELLGKHEGPVVVTTGDTPLVNGAVVQRLVQHFAEYRAMVVMASFELEDPTGYGRVVRDKHGGLLRIVEQKDGYDEVLRIKEVNAGLYCFDGQMLFEGLPDLIPNNKQGELYLTDMISLIVRKHGRAEVERFADPEDFYGVNDRWQLAHVERVMRMKILKQHALNGVTIRDPETVFISPDVRIEPETIIEPCTSLGGHTHIGRQCRIGPYSIIDDSEIGEECLVYMSRLSEAKLGDKIKVGPFANLRPGAVLGDKVKVGNFVEVKKSDLGESVSLSHLTYIGDSSIGARTNVGAGTITCNYDGFKKSRTVIGEDVFIGSNNTLVAPLEIGNGAMTAAGSTITQDVPADSLAVGRSRQEVKENWARHWREKQKK